MPKFHSLQVKDIRRETADAVSIAFDVPETLKADYAFKQGQYLTIKKEINGEELRRNYSVCVSPLSGELRVAIKQVPDGRFSTFANQILKVGDTLDIMTPMGRFFTEVKKGQQKNYIGFAGGSGVTPVMSILKTVLEVEEESTFTLFYANRGFDSIIFNEDIEAMKNKYMDRFIVHHIFSEEQIEGELFNGYITAERTQQYARYFFDVNEVDEYFICGPEPMMLAIQEGLQKMEVDNKKIHLELFTVPGKRPTASGAAPKKKAFDPTKESKVKIILDGDALEFALPYAGENVLDAALKQGADLPFACKGGVCSTCRAKLIEGEVDMDVNYALEPEEVAAGFILTCQSHPRTERIVVDFDTK
ncbi:MAG: ring-1,2-phenylacetyl-CoA epoxidase subunit PaaE [Polaribacter sp.]|jgi:ring-1,2-phenylacetyl-CoA epoxidase subunit PaaE